MKEAIFAPSALRHGFTEEDFYGVLAGRYLEIRSQRGINDVYEILGKSLRGDYLHVVYRVLHGGRLRVFHISRMTEPQRRRFRSLQR